MVLVTDKQYHMEDALKQKCDKMIERIKHDNDNLIIFQGDEGSGKSTMVMGVANYFAYTLNKPFTVNNVFFDLDKMLTFAQTHEKQIIVWDEAALGGMGAEWQNKTQKKLIKMLMVARKKNHSFFFVIPKFHKLNEYIAVDRAIGLVHVYAKDGIERGTFVYFDRSKKDKLYYQMKKTHFRNYKKYSFRGRYSKKGFVINEQDYDKKKDQAILDMFKEEESAKDIKLKSELGNVGTFYMDSDEYTRKRMQEQFKRNHGCFKTHKRRYKSYISLENEQKNQETETTIINYGSKSLTPNPTDIYNRHDEAQNDTD